MRGELLGKGRARPPFTLQGARIGWSVRLWVARESGAVPRWTSPCRRQEVLSWAYGCDSAVGLQAGPRSRPAPGSANMCIAFQQFVRIAPGVRAAIAYTGCVYSTGLDHECVAAP